MASIEANRLRDRARPTWTTLAAPRYPPITCSTRFRAGFAAVWSCGPADQLTSTSSPRRTHPLRSRPANNLSRESFGRMQQDDSFLRAALAGYEQELHRIE